MYQSFNQREFVFLDMADTNTMCYSTLGLTNLHCFTFVIGLIYN